MRSPLPPPSRLRRLPRLLPAALLLSACSLLDAGRKADPAAEAWDTSFTVDGVGFASRSEAVRRAWTHPGGRERLAGFFRKCRSGGTITVGFIGGSITAGASATEVSRRYSTTFCRFLGNLFPAADFVEVNAGIGATDSRYGASRAQDDLLRHAPDLIVIEFAVNDDFSDTAHVKATMEGLIRRCLAGSAPVALLHWMNRAGTGINQRIQTDLARHYGLPVISYLEGMRPLIDAGGIHIDTVMADAVHPTDRGHLICAYMLYAYFRKEAFARADAGKPIPGLPAPSASALYESAGLWGNGDTTLRADSAEGWIRTASDLGRVEYTAVRPGAGLRVRGRMREFAIGYWRRKDRTGVVIVSLDGADVDTLRAEFPEDWGGGGYLQVRRIFALPDPAEHEIGFRLAAGDTLELKAFLYAGK